MKKKLILSLIGLITVGLVGIIIYPKFFPSPQAKQERTVLYWTDPMIPGYKSDKPGKSPMGMELVPVYEDSAQTLQSQKNENQEGEIDYYTCTMHTSVREAKPGKCPICSMDLVPVLKKAKATKQ